MARSSNKKQSPRAFAWGDFYCYRMRFFVKEMNMVRKYVKRANNYWIYGGECDILNLPYENITYFV